MADYITKKLEAAADWVGDADEFAMFLVRFFLFITGCIVLGFVVFIVVLFAYNALADQVGNTAAAWIGWSLMLLGFWRLIRWASK